MDNIINSRYRKIKEIGVGSFCKIYKAEDIQTNKIVALKKYYKKNYNDNNSHNPFFNKELYVLSRCKDSSYIIDLFDNFTIDNVNYIVVEYFEYDLGMYLDSYYDNLNILNTKVLLFKICKGIEYLHNNGIIHRDIKPSNILLSKDNIIKLSDFNTASILDNNERSINVCTRYYRAPEIIFGCKNYGKEVDIWSLGCLFFEILFNKILFDGSSDIEQLNKIYKILGTPEQNNFNNVTEYPFYFKFKASEYIGLENHIQNISSTTNNNTYTAELTKLILGMVTLDPKKRSTISDILSSDYFNNINNEVQNKAITYF